MPYRFVISLTSIGLAMLPVVVLLDARTKKRLLLLITLNARGLGSVLAPNTTKCVFHRCSNNARPALPLRSHFQTKPQQSLHPTRTLMPIDPAIARAVTACLAAPG